VHAIVKQEIELGEYLEIAKEKGLDITLALEYLESIFIVSTCPQQLE
jgi:hypothetical protein